MQRLRREADTLLDIFPASDTVEAFRQIFCYIIDRNI